MNNQPTNPPTPSSSQAHPWLTEPQIPPTRQQFLTQCLAIKPDIKQGTYPFKDIKLTRADIEWLLASHGPIDPDDPQQRQRTGLDLRGADLQHVDLSGLPLANVCGGLTRNEWAAATTEQRFMAGVQLQDADLSNAQLQGAILQGANLQRATLRRTQLQKTNLFRACLQQAYLRGAHLEAAQLREAHLEGASLRETLLQGAHLRGAFFDAETSLYGAKLSDEKLGVVSLADVHWGDMNLAVVDWSQVSILGDEYRARQQKMSSGVAIGREKHLKRCQSAVRANRQLALAMQAQGMNEMAVRFAYRAQVLQRKVLWRQMMWGLVEAQPSDSTVRKWRRRGQKFGACVFSWFLDMLAGYGYKPGRSLLIYLLVIAVFATCYSVFGHLSPLEALVFSVTSFHGRGFLPGPFALSNPVTALAALEAVVGLFIEISFIATFTQRFFGR